MRNVSFLFFSIDATDHYGRLGRYVNDSSPADPQLNSRMKKVVINNVPHLILFASRDIASGEEIRYDYGEIGWWRKVSVNSVIHVTKTGLEKNCR